MLEYVFFHKVLAENFARRSRSFGLETSLIEDEPAWEVHLPEDIEEDIEQQISNYYDELFEQDQDMYDLESGKSEDEYNAAAIDLELKNGIKAYAQTDQKIMAKILSVVTFEELNRFVSDIVFAVENPDERTICQRYRDLQENQ
jgi:hypothetical protein